jgi:2-haloacid dehalogenase
VRISDFTTLSFDCSGTLVDWETGILDRLRPWIDRHHRGVTDSEVLKAFGDAESDLQAETPAARYPDILARVHGRIADRLGMARDAEMAAGFGHSVGDWPVFDDTHDALVDLGGGHRLVILSNVDRASFPRTQARIGVEFDAVYTAEEIGSYKPDPRNFAYLIEHERLAGVEPDRILHVGQSLFHDHEPAARAGLARCWINRPSPRADLGAARPPMSDVDVDLQFSSMAGLAAFGR